jgi:hypothetical protein
MAEEDIVQIFQQQLKRAQGAANTLDASGAPQNTLADPEVNTVAGAAKFLSNRRGAVAAANQQLELMRREGEPPEAVAIRDNIAELLQQRDAISNTDFVGIGPEPTGKRRFFFGFNAPQLVSDQARAWRAASDPLAFAKRKATNEKIKAELLSQTTRGIREQIETLRALGDNLTADALEQQTARITGEDFAEEFGLSLSRQRSDRAIRELTEQLGYPPPHEMQEDIRKQFISNAVSIDVANSTNAAVRNARTKAESDILLRWAPYPEIEATDVLPNATPNQIKNFKIAQKQKWAEVERERRKTRLIDRNKIGAEWDKTFKRVADEMKLNTGFMTITPEGAEATDELFRQSGMRNPFGAQPGMKAFMTRNLPIDITAAVRRTKEIMLAGLATVHDEGRFTDADTTRQEMEGIVNLLAEDYAHQVDSMREWSQEKFDAQMDIEHERLNPPALPADFSGTGGKWAAEIAAAEGLINPPPGVPGSTTDEQESANKALRNEVDLLTDKVVGSGGTGSK